MSSTGEMEPAAPNDVPREQSQPRRSETERSAAQHGSVRNEHWKKKNLLSLGISDLACDISRSSTDTSLDGGGVRGFWTLLVLQLLATYIYTEEVNQAIAAGESRDEIHSFWPLRYPKHVSQCENASQRRSEEDPDDGDGSRSIPGTETQAVLFCHYFDIICGTSTGR
jgi:hypothetical protein